MPRKDTTDDPTPNAITARFAASELEAIEKYAKEIDRPKAWIIRTATINYLKANGVNIQSQAKGDANG
jgi:hypothetical protein